jgi:hypothetical protein
MIGTEGWFSRLSPLRMRSRPTTVYRWLANGHASTPKSTAPEQIRYIRMLGIDAWLGTESGVGSGGLRSVAWNDHWPLIDTEVFGYEFKEMRLDCVRVPCADEEL